MTGIVMPLDECEDLINNWRRMYPEFTRAYYKSMTFFEKRGIRKGCTAACKDQPHVHMLPRTPYQTPTYRGPRDYPNTGWNRIVQGSLALFMRMWLIAIEKDWPGYAVLTIHDSVVIDAPLDEGQEIACEIARWAGDRASRLFGLPMSADVGMWTVYDRAAADNNQYDNISGNFVNLKPVARG
jgi:hypothetical protein